jgi:hypothetical protein
MSKNKLYECQVAFTYEATDPVDAARQLIANIQMNPNWFVTVTDTDNPEHKFSVDTETGECEEEMRREFEQALLKLQEWDLYCEECGWIGNEDELKTAMLENEFNRQDKTLYESKVCPECRKNNFSK